MKILLVEDNAKLNEATKIYLEDQGFDVDIAFNGVQALSKIKDFKKENHEYDVIILDIMMPMKDGIETLRDIKNMGIESGIIILSAKDTIDDKVFGLAAGADDYMIKPFNVKELIARIHSLYRRNILRLDLLKNDSSSNILDKNINSNKKINNKSFDFDFNLNLGEIDFRKGDIDINIILTQKEANIFKLLLENVNDSVSKDFVLERIWKESEAPSSRFVDVHVHNLRNKLIKNDFAGRIETVRGIGYKLILDR